MLKKKTKKILVKLMSLGFAAQMALSPVAYAASSASATVTLGVGYNGTIQEKSYCVTVNKEKVCKTYIDKYDKSGNLIESGRAAVVAELDALEGAKREGEDDGQTRLSRVFIDKDFQVNESSGTGNTSETHEATTIINCAAGTILDAASKVCCPADSNGIFDAATGKCGPKDGSTDDGTDTRSNETEKPDDGDGNGGGDPTEPTETYTCNDEGFVLDPTYKVCCPADKDGNALGTYDPATQKCTAASTTEATESTLKCDAGYIKDAKYDFCCPTNDDGTAVGAYDPATGKCGTEEKKDVTPTCASGTHLDEASGKCCPDGTTYDSGSGVCKNNNENSGGDEGGNNLSSIGTLAGAGLLLSSLFKGGVGAGNNQNGTNPLSEGNMVGNPTAESSTLPFGYQFVSSKEDGEKIYASSNKADKVADDLTWGELTSGNVYFKVTGWANDAAKKAYGGKALNDMLDGVAIMPPGSGMYGDAQHRRTEITEGVPVPVVDEGAEWDAAEKMQSASFNKDSKSANADLFVYVFMKNPQGKGSKPFMVPLRLGSTVNTLSEANDKNRKITVSVVGAGEVESVQMHDVQAKVLSAEMSDGKCIVKLDTQGMTGFLGTQGEGADSKNNYVEERNDVDFSGVKSVTFEYQMPAGTEDKCTELADKQIVLDNARISDPTELNGELVIVPDEVTHLRVPDESEDNWNAYRIEAKGAMDLRTYSFWAQGNGDDVVVAEGQDGTTRYFIQKQSGELQLIDNDFLEKAGGFESPAAYFKDNLTKRLVTGDNCDIAVNRCWHGEYDKILEVANAEGDIDMSQASEADGAQEIVKILESRGKIVIDAQNHTVTIGDKVIAPDVASARYNGIATYIGKETQSKDKYTPTVAEGKMKIPEVALGTAGSIGTAFNLGKTPFTITATGGNNSVTAQVSDSSDRTTNAKAK